MAPHHAHDPYRRSLLRWLQKVTWYASDPCADDQDNSRNACLWKVYRHCLWQQFCGKSWLGMGSMHPQEYLICVALEDLRRMIQLPSGRLSWMVVLIRSAQRPASCSAMITDIDRHEFCCRHGTHSKKGMWQDPRGAGQTTGALRERHVGLYLQDVALQDGIAAGADSQDGRLVHEIHEVCTSGACSGASDPPQIDVLCQPFIPRMHLQNISSALHVPVYPPSAFQTCRKACARRIGLQTANGNNVSPAQPSNCIWPIGLCMGKGCLWRRQQQADLSRL